MRILQSAALSIFLALTAQAQQPQASPSASPAALGSPRIPMWRCELPGGTYEVALSAILAVSQHEYTVDNAARVTEVNIDTSGSMAVRFYYLEPNIPTSPLGLGQSTLDKAQEMVREATDRTGQSDIWTKVVKNYPLTTHARTIEYRLETKEQLEKLFHSADVAFRTGRNTTFKLEEK